MITNIKITEPNGNIFPLQNYVADNQEKVLYVNPTEVLPGDLLIIENTEVFIEKPKQSAKKEGILLFAFSSSRGVTLTKSGKQYLINNNLWQQFQLKIAKQNNIKYSKDPRNNLLSSYNRHKSNKK